MSQWFTIHSVTYVNIFAVAISEWFAGIVGIDVTIAIFQFSKPNHYTQCSLYHIHHNNIIIANRIKCNYNALLFHLCLREVSYQQGSDLLADRHKFLVFPGLGDTLYHWDQLKWGNSDLWPLAVALRAETSQEQTLQSLLVLLIWLEIFNGPSRELHCLK